MKAYFQAFINFKQNNQAWFLSIMDFVYNNVKNASISYIFFKINYKYHPYIFYKKNLNLRSKLKTTKELSFKLQNLIAIYQPNFYHAQKLQKQAHNKGINPQNYALGKKVQLNSKHFKIKQNYKLEVKFLSLF